MTTPSRERFELAHKIADELFHLPFGTDQDKAGKWLEEQIARALERAFKEGKNEGYNDGAHDILDHIGGELK